MTQRNQTVTESKEGEQIFDLSIFTTITREQAESLAVQLCTRLGWTVETRMVSHEVRLTGEGS